MQISTFRTKSICGGASPPSGGREGRSARVRICARHDAGHCHFQCGERLFQLLRALDQLLYVTERTVATREKFVELTRAQFNRGVVSGLDVNRAEASLAARRAPRFRISKARSRRPKINCRLLLGENPAPICARSVVRRWSFFRRRRKCRWGCPATLLERRPDLRQAENNLIGANARLKVDQGVAVSDHFADRQPGIGERGTRRSVHRPRENLVVRIWVCCCPSSTSTATSTRSTFTRRARSSDRAVSAVRGQAFREVSDALAARQGASEALSRPTSKWALRAAREQVLKRYPSASRRISR